MAEESSGLRPFPVRVIRWLGHDVLAEHPAIQMLHEARAMETARDKTLPIQERQSYKIRQQRIFARGGGATRPGDNEIAMSPQEKAAAEAAKAAAEAAAAAIAEAKARIEATDAPAHGGGDEAAG